MSSMNAPYYLPDGLARQREQHQLERVVRVAFGHDNQAVDENEAAAFLAAARLVAVRFPQYALRLQQAGLARWPQGAQMPTWKLVESQWGGDRLRLADTLERYFTPNAATPYPRVESPRRVAA